MTRQGRSALQAVVLCIALAIFWIACAASLHAHELITGIPAVLLAAGFCLFTVLRLPLRFRPAAMELAEIWRLPWYVLQGASEITWVLLKDVAGNRAPSLFRSAPWRENAPTGEATARRVLAISYTTVAPNFIVVGIDCTSGQMLFHQVQESGVPLMTQRLGAGDGR